MAEVEHKLISTDDSYGIEIKDWKIIGYKRNIANAEEIEQ